MRIWEEVGESLPVPRKAEGTEGSLPWANFSPFRQGTIPLLPRFPSPAPWEWSEQVLTHTGLEGPSITGQSRASSCSAPSLVSGGRSAHRRPLRSSRGLAGTSGDWGADLKSAYPSPTSYGAGEEQGQLWAAPWRAGAAADSQMEIPPPSHRSSQVRCRQRPSARAAVLARWARPQAAGRPLRAELGQRSLSPGGHPGSGRSPASSSPVRPTGQAGTALAQAVPAESCAAARLSRCPPQDAQMPTSHTLGSRPAQTASRRRRSQHLAL